MPLAKLQTRFDKIMSSFWFVPGLLILAHVLLFFLTLWMDSLDLGQEIGADISDALGGTTEPSGAKVPWFGTTSAASTRVVLSMIAGAMAGIAGTVFSITLVVLQLASAQLGPRLLNNFMYERINQVVLGQFLGLFLFSLLVVNTIKDDAGLTELPHWSVATAILLSIVNSGLLILFIHNVSVSIQPSRIVRTLNKRIEKNLHQLYPEGAEEAWMTENKKAALTESYRFRSPCFPKDTGYVEYINLDSLAKLADKKDWLIKVLVKPGSFVVEQKPILEVHGHAEEELSDEHRDALCSAFSIYRSKTYKQDTGFAIRQVTEIATKSLSPGINDPNTAHICIDHLTSSLALLLQRSIPNRVLAREDGQALVVADADRFPDFLEASFDPIRQFGAQIPDIAAHLLESLQTLYSVDRDSRESQTLRAYARRVMDTALQADPVEDDRERLQDLFAPFELVGQQEEKATEGKAEAAS